MDILLGIVGGIVGGVIVRLLGFYSTGGLIPSILIAILGAVILVAIARKLKTGKPSTTSHIHVSAGKSSTRERSKLSRAFQWGPGFSFIEHHGRSLIRAW